MNKEDICFLSACEMKEKIATQELTSLEITETIIERINKINPIINAFCTPTFDLAREKAKKADEAVKKGDKELLRGIPCSIKDLALTKGIRTTFGSKMYEHFIPKVDSIYVERLKDAGCVIIGKTNTPEFGFKGATNNLIFGTTKNPWNLDKTCGGSSGGAGAAVASGISPLAQGSDGGGSIRIPASLNGVYGIKPSFGRVPDYPKEYIFAHTLSVSGPITRYVKDAALMLDVMKGPFEGYRHSLPAEDISYYEQVELKPSKLKVAYSLDMGYAKVLDSEVEKSVLDSVEKFNSFGWEPEKVKMKLKKPELAFYTIWISELGYSLRSKLKEWRDKMDPDLVRMIEGGLGYDGPSIIRAMEARKAVFEGFYKIFKNFDILITPTTAVPAFDLGKSFPTKINGKNVSPTAWQAFTFPINLIGNPAASIPCGWSKEGLPLGMQIIGRRFQDIVVLQVSKAFEEIAPWQDKRPSF
ncbi:MAG: amidase [Promethearchaeota archaeon]|nr:MAG: amidase [Candidatus Lokiarchaeota archaeon]